MSPRAITIEDALSLLAAAPRRIAELTAGLSPEQLRKRPTAREWSANDVLAHLRACEDVRGGYIRAIIAEDKPTLRTVNPRAWMRRTDYPELHFDDSLRAFQEQRAELVALLEALPPEGWARSATLVGPARRLELTPLYCAEWLVVHERPHLQQIERVVEGLRG